MGTSQITTFDPTRVSSEELDVLRHATHAVAPGSAVNTILTAILSAAERGESITTVSAHHPLSPNEAAQIAGMSRPHLMTFVRNGALKASKVGTHHRITLSDLNDFMDRRQRAARDVAAAIASRPQTPRIELSAEELEELDEL